MARLYELSTLVSRAQELADVENQGNITPATWQAWIGQLHGRLHGIVASTGYRYFEAVQTITTDGNSFYSLPADHFMSGTVTRVVSHEDRRPLRRLSAQRTALVPQAAAAPSSGEACNWALVGQQIILCMGKPPAGQTYEHRYIPQPADLTTALGTTQVDVVTPDGESFVLHGVAVKALVKMRMNPSFHLDERNVAEGNLREWAALRSLHEGHITESQSLEQDGFWDPADYRDRSGAW